MPCAEQQADVPTTTTVAWNGSTFTRYDSLNDYILPNTYRPGDPRLPRQSVKASKFPELSVMVPCHTPIALSIIRQPAVARLSGLRTSWLSTP